MNDSNPSHAGDGIAVMAFLAIALATGVGISAAIRDMQGKDDEIAQLQQQLADARRGIDFCSGELNGYVKGRR